MQQTTENAPPVSVVASVPGLVAVWIGRVLTMIAVLVLCGAAMLVVRSAGPLAKPVPPGGEVVIDWND